MTNKIPSDISKSHEQYLVRVPTSTGSANCSAAYTTNQWYRTGFRPLGKPTGQLIILHARPHHSMRQQFWPLEESELLDLKIRLRKDPEDFDTQELLWRAQRAGQVTAANLYADAEKIVTPTEKEAALMLELSFRHGHDRDTWIVSTPEKKTWTVGTTFLRPYRFLEHLRGEWFHGVVQAEAEGETDWIVIDLDRHSGLVPVLLHLQRAKELYDLLVQDRYHPMLQVNPKNGSLHIWVPVKTMPYSSARQIIAGWRAKLTWLVGVEIFPDNLHQVILPLRPDKLLICDRLVPRVKRKGFRYNKISKKKKGYTVSAYSCVYVWKWLQKPQVAPWQLWETAIQQASANTPDLEQQIEQGTTSVKKPRKQTPKKLVPTGRGSLGPLKGKWLPLLVDTYINGVRPPDDTIGIIEQGIIRHCMVGKGLSAEETKLVLEDLRSRLPDTSFSDRLEAGGAELDRINEYLLADPLRYLPDPERSKKTWQAVEAYCVKIGFDITEPDTWKLPKPKLKLAQSATLLTLTGQVALAMGCDLKVATALLERVAHHALHKYEIAYSLMKKFLEDVGLAPTNNRAAAVFKLLREAGFLVLRHKYYHDPVSGYRHGNFFVLGAWVTEREEEEDVSILSLSGVVNTPGEAALWVMWVRCRECETAFHKRLEKLWRRKMAA